MQSYNIFMYICLPEISHSMQYLKLFFLSLLLFALLPGCNKELNVNADWKDITVVYALLDQARDTTFIKITKAFLGPGDALQFAKISDSSNYPDKLVVRLEEWDGSTYKNTFFLDTLTIHNKVAGDSVFYYPDQLMYFTTVKLNENYQYKLYIDDTISGKEVTAESGLVHDFAIEKPLPYFKMDFRPEYNNEVKWYTAKAGRRYQMNIRFHYQEILKADTSVKATKYIDWIVFSDIKSIDLQGGQEISQYYSCNGFYNVIGANIPVNPNVNRKALFVDLIFSVAAEDLNTYMEVTEPSYTIIQERPSFTNIVNGIGLFSSRYTKALDSMLLSAFTLNELKVNEKTKSLGF